MKLLASILRIFGLAEKAADADEKDGLALAELRKQSKSAGQIAEETEARAKALRDRGGRP